MPTDSGNATYLDAVGLALDHEMDADPDVFIIGEDVGQFGGAFKVTKGFLEKFGRSSSSSSPTSSPAPSTRSSTCWHATTTARATPCR